MLIKHLFIFIIFCFFLSVYAYAQDTKQRYIQVQGNAEIKVKPDEYLWQLSIQTEDDDIIAAKKQNDASTSKVLDLLRSAGVEEDEIRTSGIHYAKNLKNINDPKRKNYSVANLIWFTLKNISKYDELTSSLIQIENVFINNMASDYSKKIETRNDARLQAIDAAKDKAVKMAARLNQDIGKPISIIEGSNQGYYPNPFNVETKTYNMQESTSSTFNEGTISITAQVSIIFELINR